uniref:Gsp_32 putative toxin n=1 Tax=Gemmula speciosa TaxID=439592 RepID=A0A098LWB3_GEMSP
MTCLPLFIVTIIVVYSINVAADGQFKNACDDQHPCHEDLECSRNKCLIPYGSDLECVTGWDCVKGVVCHYNAGRPGRCIEDHRCPDSRVCENPATECDEDNVCGYKEGETCYGPCRAGLTCRDRTCQK